MHFNLFSFYRLIISMLICTHLISSLANAQRINYSPVENLEYERTHYEIVAKTEGRILIYKAINHNFFNSYNTVINNTLLIYDNEMNLLQRKKLNLPDELFGVRFLAYENFIYMIYQYQQGNKVHCMISKINSQGDLAEKPVELDETDGLDYWKKNQIYTVINSENKEYIMVLTEKRTNGLERITTVLFNRNLESLHRSVFQIPVMEGKDFLTEFTLDNEGNFVFLRTSESGKKDYLLRTNLIIKKPFEDSVSYNNFLPANLYVDDIKLRVDNNNQKYVLTSFYSDQLKGDINGIYCVLWDQKTNEPEITKTRFDNPLRNEVNAHGKVREAFNDYYIQNLRLRKDGGFIVEAEYLYRFAKRKDTIQYSRWNYLYNFYDELPTGYISNDSYTYNHYYPWKEWKQLERKNNIFSGEKIVVFSFDSSASIEWIKVLDKHQLVSYFYPQIGYTTLLQKDMVYFFFNEIVNDHINMRTQRINSKGELKDDIFFKDVDNEYTCLPRYGKQVSSNELIVPCITRKGYLSFAKVVFDWK